ncbi:uncharacterized protein At4g22758-like [Lycium ferocissimum]|uniref:uncharacterized protein At4g22758-like n=1 Tax=Lycium ferocissimum TaxID=112874 RepID=UPI002814C2F5|nr:uncharacterized protein At4g22758-like [Lycium ferocissimum]XP_059278196.1 uncharacterized protein At4g22758-like [Lycium ferocissimum]
MMPSPRTHHRRGSNDDKNPTKIRLSEKSKSFHGQTSGSSSKPELLRRPKTVPDLLAGRKSDSTAVNIRPMKMMKLLVNVTIQRSVGPVQVLISLESTVVDLIAAALQQYSKEGRRPVLSSIDAADYDLHYSQFSLESLKREEKLNASGSRNFFMCPRNGGPTTSSSSCGKQADTSTKIPLPWLKFMDFLM